MNMTDTLTFIASGFAIVLLALSLLWMVSAIIGRVFAGATSRLTAPPVRTTPPSPASVDATPAARAGIPPAHLAAISAAVAVMTGGRGQVVSVRAPAHLSGAWSREGRTDQFSSHRVRWDWDVAAPSTAGPKAPEQRPPSPLPSTNKSKQ
ncbi:MAG: OadG family protein [Azoarcus sp.]|nr:OadG family protein [Azoarcus sp.]